MDCLILKTYPFERNAPRGQCFDFRAFASCQNGQSYNEADAPCAFWAGASHFYECFIAGPHCTLARIQLVGL